MIELTATEGTDKLRLSQKMLVEELMSRQWRVERYHAATNHMRVVRPDGKTLEFSSILPPTTSYVAALRADDKYLTSLMMSEQGIPVPDVRRVQAADEAAIIAAAEELFAAGHTLVVKPLDAAHGNGVSVDLTSIEAVHEAVVFASKYSKIILIQECIHAAIDVRITCIDGVMAAALERIPARVMGDGQQTLSELIDTTNAQPNRGYNYANELNRIDKQLVERYLGDVLHAEIPEEGAYRQLLGTANVGTGGETRDVTDELPAWLVAMAEKAAAISGLPVCGIDFLLSSVPVPDATIADLKPVIIELNCSPALFIHETPTHGTPRRVIAAYADYLQTI